MTSVNDIVLIYFEDNPLAFARIEAIRPDAKSGWYQIRLLLLQVPLQAVTWILREAYINGAEFTMNGKRMRLEKVSAPPEEPTAMPGVDRKSAEQRPEAEVGAQVISLADLKKR